MTTPNAQPAKAYTFHFFATNDAELVDSLLASAEQLAAKLPPVNSLTEIDVTAARAKLSDAHTALKALVPAVVQPPNGVNPL